MTKVYITILTLGLAYLGNIYLSTKAIFEDSQMVISVKGKAVTEHQPNLLILKLSVKSSLEPSSSDARNHLKVAIKKFTQKNPDIETTIDPETVSSRYIKIDGKFSRSYTGYQRLTLTIPKSQFTQVPQILKTAIGSGINQIEGSQFKVINKPDIRKEENQHAIEDAHKTAHSIASAIEKKAKLYKRNIASGRGFGRHVGRGYGHSAMVESEGFADGNVETVDIKSHVVALSELTLKEPRYTGPINITSTIKPAAVYSHTAVVLEFEIY
jgi:uncharacterized protein YggE